MIISLHDEEEELGQKRKNIQIKSNLNNKIKITKLYRKITYIFKAEKKKNKNEIYII